MKGSLEHKIDVNHSICSACKIKDLLKPIPLEAVKLLQDQKIIQTIFFHVNKKTIGA